MMTIPTRHAVDQASQRQTLATANDKVILEQRYTAENRELRVGADVFEILQRVSLASRAPARNRPSTSPSPAPAPMIDGRFG